MKVMKDNIKYYREKNAITKSELARRIGVSPSYITMLENGEKNNPSLEIQLKIASVLNVSIEDIFTESLTEKDLENFDRNTNSLRKDISITEAIDLLLKEKGHTISDFNEDEYEKIKNSLLEFLDTIAYMKK